jgi:hypothetical protein
VHLMRMEGGVSGGVDELAVPPPGAARHGAPAAAVPTVRAARGGDTAGTAVNHPMSPLQITIPNPNYEKHQMG